MEPNWLITVALVAPGIAAFYFFVRGWNSLIQPWLNTASAGRSPKRNFIICALLLVLLAVLIIFRPSLAPLEINYWRNFLVLVALTIILGVGFAIWSAGWALVFWKWSQRQYTGRAARLIMLRLAIAAAIATSTAVIPLVLFAALAA